MEVQVLLARPRPSGELAIIAVCRTAVGGSKPLWGAIKVLPLKHSEDVRRFRTPQAAGSTPASGLGAGRLTGRHCVCTAGIRVQLPACPPFPGPVVYWLGLLSFKQSERVRSPPGLPLSQARSSVPHLLPLLLGEEQGPQQGRWHGQNANNDSVAMWRRS